MGRPERPDRLDEPRLASAARTARTSWPSRSTAIAEETGALFVVAAGNSGAPETVGSPGSAEQALTVGSVDDPTGALSYFSSQGPLTRSGAMKPDVTGPGNDVTAARSADSGGEGSYITMSGTSMATPARRGRRRDPASSGIRTTPPRS